MLAQDIALSVAGDGLSPLRLSLEDLKRLPQETLGETELVCLTGAQLGTAGSYRGVRLCALLDAAGFSALKTGVLKQTVVMVVSADGYRALFTWHELYNTPVGAQVLLLHERDGRPLGEDEGPLALISTLDLRNGPRHLKGVVRIETRLL
jgi:DMSO/TMAO reductase YedYZ molybdopterin-dependent catalytic subunit